MNSAPPLTAASFVRSMPETRRNSSVLVLCWPGSNGHFGIMVILTARHDHASYCVCCIPTYLIHISVKQFLITVLNCLNTEGIPAHSEKYTVRDSILILLPTVTIMLCETSSTASRSNSAIRDFRVYLYNTMTSPRCKCTAAAPCG